MIGSIMKVPLLENVRDNKIVWQEEQHGKYNTMQSGYRRYLRNRNFTSTGRVVLLMRCRLLQVCNMFSLIFAFRN
ncbi:hypothetical protein L195_g038817 [Trifolium pratense]|uniref:Uncharacterized protein n=1 Tax=Trifolium pratense TaxID=57577 RepID=A0A2K3LW68_TRIPR|nr:hypothetical protein L195_g038817 [Trifolium pratense]